MSHSTLLSTAIMIFTYSHHCTRTQTGARISILYLSLTYSLTHMHANTKAHTLTYATTHGNAYRPCGSQHVLPQSASHNKAPREGRYVCCSLTVWADASMRTQVVDWDIKVDLPFGAGGFIEHRHRADARPRNFTFCVRTRRELEKKLRSGGDVCLELIACEPWKRTKN